MRKRLLLLPFLLLVLVAAFSWRAATVEVPADLQRFEHLAATAPLPPTATRHQANSSPQTAELPLEVFPPDGGSAHVEAVTLSTSAPADTVFVKLSEAGYDRTDYAEANGYDTMASLRISGGDGSYTSEWIPLDNSQPMYYPERRAGGVWGLRQPVRMAVPVADYGPQIPAGTVTLEFRFNGTEGVSSGYRVLDIDLRSGTEYTSSGADAEGFGASVLDGVTFTSPDYAAWKAPAGYEDSVAAGRELWFSVPLLESPHQDARPLQAACADCHTDDGRDLKYFNYSNRSIISRSRFHNLTEEQGKKIAAYIRSVDLKLPEGYTANHTGRPWNPPYQPGTICSGPLAGTKLSEAPVELWAAGAGACAILDRDAEMEPALEAQYRADKFSAKEHLDIIDIPLAIAFEPWNRWLPDIHPYDTFGKDTWEATQANKKYEKLKTALETTPLETLVDQMDFNHNGVVGGIFELVNDFSLNPPKRMLPEGYMKAIKADRYPFVAKASLHQWNAVKLLGLSWKYKLEDLGYETYYEVPRDHGGGRQAADPELWFTRDRMSLHTWRVFFDVAPHMNAKFAANGQRGWRDASAYPVPPGGPKIGGPVSCTWYAQQQVLADGGGVTGTQAPMDWKYNWTLCNDYGNLVGEEPYFYHILSQVVEQQNALGGAYAYSFDKDRRAYGLDWPSINPWWLLTSWSKAAGRSRPAPWNMPSAVQPGKTLAQVWEPRRWAPLLKALRTYEDNPHAVDTKEEALFAYARAPEGDCNGARVECRSYMPKIIGNVHAQSGMANNIFSLLKAYDAMGIRPAVSDSIAAEFSQVFTGVPAYSLSGTGGAPPTPLEYWRTPFTTAAPEEPSR